jgi:predicted SnoaL-like aldol condensation-catalyzing enzyme
MELMSNKMLVRNFYEQFFNQHNIEAADQYVREDYIQHNPGVAQGREGLKEGFANKFKIDPTFRLEIKMLIEEDDLVVVYLKNVDPEGNTKARVVDIYRIEDGKLAEHWDVLHPVSK